MNAREQERYRGRLLAEAAKVQSAAEGLEEGARMPTGGQTSGLLSNAPMHLADLGTETYFQEISATLLENEVQIRDEIVAALGRIEEGTYGQCENCGQVIVAERLEVLPYTRYCTDCAASMPAARPVNLNDGRVQPGPQTLNPHDDRPAPKGGDHADSFAAGTAGGGTAIGGLAGTNIGDGDPENVDLESPLGTGRSDVEIESVEENEVPAYSGRSGGAVGGTPAGKRVVGGKIHRGIAPHPDPGDSPTGP
jgi:DnaK suppressor protein